MGLMIKVELKDGTLCRMAPKALDIFLARDKVSRFERAAGWAVVGRDPIRTTRRNNDCCYRGPERRKAA